MLLSALVFLSQGAYAPATPPASATLGPITTATVPRPEPASAANLGTRPTQTLSKRAIGRNVATQNCQSCHAIGRTGQSPNPAAPKFRNLSQNYPIDDLSEAFAEGVLVGHSVMPEFEFSPDKVDALMTYIKSVQVRVRPKRRK